MTQPQEFPQAGSPVEGVVPQEDSTPHPSPPAPAQVTLPRIANPAPSTVGHWVAATNTTLPKPKLAQSSRDEQAAEIVASLMGKLGVKKKATVDLPEWSQSLKGQTDVQTFLKKDGRVFAIIFLIFFGSFTYLFLLYKMKETAPKAHPLNPAFTQNQPVQSPYANTSAPAQQLPAQATFAAPASNGIPNAAFGAAGSVYAAQPKSAYSYSTAYPTPQPQPQYAYQPASAPVYAPAQVYTAQPAYAPMQAYPQQVVPTYQAGYANDGSYLNYQTPSAGMPNYTSSQYSFTQPCAPAQGAPAAFSPPIVPGATRNKVCVTR